VKVFLTGGTGYLGGHVARALLGAGHEVLALTRSLERCASLVGCGATPVVGDLLDPSTWGDRIAEADAVVHTAAMVESWGPAPEEFDRANITATLDLLDRAKQAGVERRIVTSSLFALGPSAPGTQKDESALEEEPGSWSRANDYVRTKAIVARKVRDRQRRGSPAILIFPTVLIGPGALTKGNHTARVLADVGRKRFAGLVGDGRQVWNLARVDRVAIGFVQALERGTPGENYILGGENWTQRELVERAARAFGVKPPTRRLGRALPLAVARGSAWWSALRGTPPILTRGEVLLYDCNWEFTSERARRELGYEPEGVQEALESTVAWLRDEVWARAER
jgi:nucleoside-diphosphate-sugar epimerase